MKHTHRNKLIAMVLAVCLMASLFPQAALAVKVQRIEIFSNSGSSMVQVRDTLQLRVEGEPQDADDFTVTWRSDDPSIARVDENGRVTGVSTGRTGIVAATGWTEAWYEIRVVDLDPSSRLVNTLEELEAALRESGVTEIVVGRTIELTDGTDLNGQGKTIRVAAPGLNANGGEERDVAWNGIFSLPENVSASLSNMTLRGGGTPTVRVREQAALTMTDVTIRDGVSRALEVNGGGAAKLTRCNILRNMREDTVWCGGELILDSCTLAENQGSSAALYMNGGTVYMNNSVIAHNSTSGRGGGIYMDGSANLYLMNSTVAGNMSMVYSNESCGGGVFLESTIAKVYGVNSLLCDNYYTVRGEETTRVTACDVGAITNDAALTNVRLDHCVYGAVLTGAGPGTVIGENNKTGAGCMGQGVFADYERGTHMLGSPVVNRPRPAQTVDGRFYAPVKAGGAAVSGGAATCFDAGDPANVKMAYGEASTPPGHAGACHGPGHDRPQGSRAGAGAHRRLGGYHSAQHPDHHGPHRRKGRSGGL